MADSFFFAARHFQSVPVESSMKMSACRREVRGAGGRVSAPHSWTTLRVMSRPPFIIASADVPEQSHAYPGSNEYTAPKRSIGHAAGLERIGLNLTRVPPGARTS